MYWACICVSDTEFGSGIKESSSTMKGLLLLFLAVVTVSAIPKPIQQEPKDPIKDNVGQSEKRQRFGQLLNLLERRILEKKADVPLDLDERWQEGCAVRGQSGGSPVFTEEKGIITSPGWASGSYPKDAGCMWTIQAPEGQFVEATLEHLYLAGSTTDADGYKVCGDEVTLREGTGQIIQSYCDTREHDDEGRPTSKGNKMIVQFVTDNIYTARGFKLTWRFVETQPTRSLLDQLVELLKRDD